MWNLSSKDSLYKGKKLIYQYSYNFSLRNRRVIYNHVIGGDYCDNIVINNKVFYLNNLFSESPFMGCEMDVASLRLYSFSFARRKYVCIIGVSKGNGIAASLNYLHLFDITENSNIKHIPLWSYNGTIDCLNDVNHDQKLDFLKLSRVKDDIFKVSVITITSDRFVYLSEKNYSLILKRSDEGLYSIVKKKWKKH